MTTWRLWVGDHPNPYRLPPELEAELVGYDLTRAELAPFKADQFASILGDLLTRAAKSVLEFGPPDYHNGRHFAEVVVNVRALLGAMEHPVPEAVQQALLFAAAGHDFAHQGATFRKDAPSGMPLPELGVELATEEVSARIVDGLASEYGFSPPARLFISRSIGATTFGNPAIGPVSPLEQLLVCADVAPNDTFLAWYEKGVDVTFGERPAKPAPVTFSAWIANRAGFVQFYLKKVLTPEALRLGWGDTLASYEAALQRVSTGTDPVLTAILKSLLPQDRVDLTA